MKKPALRPMKSLDSAQLFSSLSRVEENSPVEAARTKPNILAIIDEIECRNNNGLPVKSVVRRHSDVQSTRKDILLSSLQAGKDSYTNKLVRQLHLRGHVKYLKENDLVLFICSPM